MNKFFLGAFLIILIIIIIYVIVIMILNASKNPGVETADLADVSTENPSIVTHAHLGERGQMGNQLFQIACLIGTAEKNHIKFVLPKRMIEQPLFHIFESENFHFEDVKPDHKFLEYDNFENINIPPDGGIYSIEGYRQSYHYFDNSFTEVIKNFQIKKELLKACQKNYEYFCVHIRKGDYIKFQHNIPILREFKRCSLDYYKQGIKKLRALTGDSLSPVIVCTDSPKEVIPLLKELDDKAILNGIPEGVKPIAGDFITMVKSKGLVISNSTFSWWAAFLSGSGMVVAPSPWWDPWSICSWGANLNNHNHLYLQNWMILNADSGNPEERKTSNEKETLNIVRLIRGFNT